MEMCICHYGSINGLSFLDRILFNGASPFFASIFSMCVKHLLLLKWSDVLALKYTHREYKVLLVILQAESLNGAWNAVGMVLNGMDGPRRQQVEYRPILYSAILLDP